MNPIENMSRFELDSLAAACSPKATKEELRAFEVACAKNEDLAQIYLEFCHFEWTSQLQHRSMRTNQLVSTKLTSGDWLAEEETSDCHVAAENNDSSVSQPLTLRSKSWLDYASRQPLPPSVMVALVGMTVFLFGLAFTPLGNLFTDKHGPRITSVKQTIATMVRHTAVEWVNGKGVPENSHRIRAGQVLGVNRGVVELRYDSGARVMIEGPAEFCVATKETDAEVAVSKGAQGSLPDSPSVNPTPLWNSGFLRFGRLVARIENKRAKGFFVDTPTARVQDYGTVFTMVVDRLGVTQTYVGSGQVIVTSRNQKEREVGPPVKLFKDDALIVGPMSRVEPIAQGDARWEALVNFTSSLLPSVPADSRAISINFSRVGQAPMQVADVTGVVPARHWNNFDLGAANRQWISLHDSTGANTNASLSVVAKDPRTWPNNTVSDAPLQMGRLFTSRFDVVGKVDLSVQGISFDHYDVYVYYYVDPGPNPKLHQFKLTINSGESILVSRPATSQACPSNRFDAYRDSTPDGTGNYFHAGGLSGDLKISAEGPGAIFLCGLQIVNADTKHVSEQWTRGVAHSSEKQNGSGRE